MTDWIHTIDDFWDGWPLRGGADFEGEPHRYDREFDEAIDDWSNVYKLTPVSLDTLSLALESSAIFKRWAKAFFRGEVDLKSHPALPEERSRYDEIQEQLSRIAEVSNDTITVLATAFRDISFYDEPHGFAEWSRLPEDRQD